MLLRFKRGGKKVSMALDTAELIERIVTLAKEDSKLAQKLYELKAIDDMNTGFIRHEDLAYSIKSQEETLSRSIKLYKDIAVAVLKTGEDVEEIETWLSYNVKKIVIKLSGGHYPK